MNVPEPQRSRVVLSQRRGARMVRTRVEVQEHTEIGDAMIRGLMRAQLGLAVRLALVTACTLGAIPLLCSVFPSLSSIVVLGIRLPWLVLGVLVYPLLFGLGRLYVRLAERNEQDFTDLVDD
ncbi:hypothetical protein [Antrihabitans cavernicola]|uniref:DUF485 domain-containing protein n=1 Tax=Antrihabitans cavernicola TaxID=2495913 RepID=A0A5A7S794_9NOCA|nr:hypothetical protein [Spelaeibacter cavernicola]KAA0021012.1 hypothetical protein FOY51_20475 [Spelaeibacter cavernicola]